MEFSSIQSSAPFPEWKMLKIQEHLASHEPHPFSSRRARKFPLNCFSKLRWWWRLRNATQRRCCCHHRSRFFSRRFFFLSRLADVEAENRRKISPSTCRPSCSLSPDFSLAENFSAILQHRQHPQLESSNVGGALSLTWALNRQGWKLVNSCGNFFCLKKKLRRRNKRLWKSGPTSRNSKHTRKFRSQLWWCK